jgi:uncharacterized protein YxeA
MKILLGLLFLLFYIIFIIYIIYIEGRKERTPYKEMWKEYYKKEKKNNKR